MISPTQIKAIGIMMLAMLFIPLGDTAGKLLTGSHGVVPVFVAWSRFFIGTILVFLAFGGRGFEYVLLKDWRIWLRAGFIVGGIVSILTALKTEPIANVFAAFFIGPILSYFAAALLFREPISWLRTLLLFVGFCGVLLVVKPGFDTSPGMLYALLAGCSYGAFLVANKWLSMAGRPRSLLFSHLVIGAIVLFPWGIGTIPVMTMDISLLILLSAAASATGNLLLVVANRMADATRLAPLVYIQLISATALGYFVFADLPDVLSLIGLGFLLVSGFVSFFLAQGRG